MTAHDAAHANEPADLADVAIGLTPEQFARYEAVIDHFLRGHYFSVNEEGRVASWNVHAEQRFGWSSLEVVGEDCFEYVAADARDELVPLLTGDGGATAGRQLT